MMDEELQLVVFNIDQEVFGVDITQVREIIKLTEITTMPNCPEHVEGVINLRGQITTVMDLRKRLGAKVNDATEHTRIIIIESGNQILGMIVDAVTEVLRISNKDIDSSDGISSSFGEYIRGVGKLNKRLLILLDLNKLISDTEIGKFVDNVKEQAEA